MTPSQPILIDMHSHWGTERGWRRSPALRHPDAMKKYFKWGGSFVSEDEQADYLRSNGVHVMLDLGTAEGMDIEELRSQHDYAFDYTAAHPDVVLGNWVHAYPEVPESLEEFKRCIVRQVGLLGLSGASLHLRPTDPFWDPYYELCMEKSIPVMMPVGMSAPGAGIRGGLGFELETRHPRYVDQVAARYPDLTILAARPAWPWQSEMIAVLLHKGNVWQELHGWAPKHYTAELKHEIQRRLRDRVMFAADYPMLRYERLVQEWHDEGYSPEVLRKVFYENAIDFCAELGHDITAAVGISKAA
jgi:predicted TIM-barrel fold metal-dependent hydrolase